MNTTTVKCHDCQDTGVTGWQFPCDCDAAKPNTSPVLHVGQQIRVYCAKLMTCPANGVVESTRVMECVSMPNYQRVTVRLDNGNKSGCGRIEASTANMLTYMQVAKCLS